MRKRPIALFLASALFLFFPVEFVWRWNHGHTLHFGDFLFSVLLPGFLGLGLMRVTKIAWYSLIGFAVVWGFKDLYEYYLSHGTNLTLMFIHFGIYCISMTYFINPRIRTLYFDPKLRWWRAKRRNETHMPVIMRYLKPGIPHWAYPIMKNVSVGGCFIEMEEEIHQGDQLEVAIPLPIPLGVSVIKATGFVRWTKELQGKQGAGIEFNVLQPAQVKALRKFVALKL